MNGGLKGIVAAALLTTGIAGVTPAMAEMGLSPTGPDRMYITLFGGYVNSDGTATPGYGSPVAPNPAQLFEVEDGGFVGVTAGYVFDTLMPLGLSNFRIEASFAASVFEDDEGSAPAASIINRAGSGTAFGFAASSQSRTVYDWSIAFKGDKELSSTLDAAFGLEVFFRLSDDRTTATISTGPFRNLDTEGFFGGVMAVVQPEWAITPSISLVTDFGAGIYAVDADVNTHSNFGLVPTSANDSDSTLGFRARAKGGLKFKASEAISISLFGGIDWWSDAPVAGQQQAIVAPFIPTTVKFNDLLELKAGLSLTVLLGGP